MLVKNNLAIIPARGGSKRIPRKNIKEFNGRPIIDYSIDAVLNSNCFDEIMVSTDDNEIAELSIKRGINVPFLRSSENSNDHAGLAEVLIEVLNEYEKQGILFNNVCCIFATAPFITSDDIKDSYKLLNKCNAVIPVVSYSYPIQRSLKLEEGFLTMNWPQYYSSRSQDLETTYHDCGLFYWMKTDVLKKEKKLFVENMSPYIFPELRTQDIDTEDDWKIAEMKYKLLNMQK